jgi:hypothetical protein
LEDFQQTCLLFVERNRFTKHVCGNKHDKQGGGEQGTSQHKISGSLPVRGALFKESVAEAGEQSERPCLRKENTFMNESKQKEETEPSWSRAMLCCFCVTTAQNRAAQTFQIGGTNNYSKHFGTIITNRN